jgi:hypothetical protein
MLLVLTSLHVSGSLSAHHQEFLAVHRLWYILCSCDEPCATRSRMELPQAVPSYSWWWSERLPETCRVVIPIKLEFSAAVGFIHKKSVTMHGHTTVKSNIEVSVVNKVKEIWFYIFLTWKKKTCCYFIDKSCVLVPGYRYNDEGTIMIIIIIIIATVVQITTTTFLMPQPLSMTLTQGILRVESTKTHV